MNPTDRFNLCRGWKLTNLYIRENSRWLALCASLMVFIIILIAWLVSLQTGYFKPNYYGVPEGTDPAWRNLFPLYSLEVLVAACIWAAYMFKELGTRQGRIHTLMVPANASEKLFSRALVYVVALPAFSLLFVFVTEFFRCQIINACHPQIAAIPLYTLTPVKALEYFGITLREGHEAVGMALYVMFFFVIQSFFVLGSLLWPKASFVKTFVVFFALTVLYFVIIYYVGETFLSGRRIDVPWLESHIRQILLFLECAACAFNWVMAWMRLRETDVITTLR